MPEELEPEDFGSDATFTSVGSQVTNSSFGWSASQVVPTRTPGLAATAVSMGEWFMPLYVRVQFTCQTIGLVLPTAG
jgi:hypothetical protein